MFYVHLFLKAMYRKTKTKKTEFCIFQKSAFTYAWQLKVKC